MIKCYYENEKNLKTRLHRIEGQVKGISKMIEEGRDCIEILNQISSIKSALKGVCKEIIRDHLNHHVADSTKNNNLSKDLIDELINSIGKIE